MYHTFDDVLPWVSVVRRQVHENNNNWVQLTVGETGSGKSSLNLAFALMLDPTFVVDKSRVAFNVRDFVRIVNDLDKIGNPRGKVVMLEEVGVGSSGSKSWMTQEARLLSEVLQTFRSQGTILLMSVPDDEMFLKDGRRLIKALFIAKGVDTNRRLVRCKPFAIKHDTQKHKTYNTYVRVHYHDNRPMKVVNRWLIPFVDKEHWQQFYEMMEEFKLGVRERALRRLNEQYNKDNEVVDEKNETKVDTAPPDLTQFFDGNPRNNPLLRCLHRKRDGTICGKIWRPQNLKVIHCINNHYGTFEIVDAEKYVKNADVNALNSIAEKRKKENESKGAVWYGASGESMVKNGV
jgi:hypothetical protein